MPDRTHLSKAQLEQGRELARTLYDLKLHTLENLSAEEHAAFLEKFPLLSEVEFKDVLRQVIEARKAEQIRVGWFTIPHDVTVLVFVLTTWILDLPYAIILGIAVLVLLESLFQVTFDQRLYVPLSALVWLTYPAYIFLAWLLYNRGMPWYWVLGVIAALWGGTYLVGMIARIPMQLMLRMRQAPPLNKSK